MCQFQIIKEDQKHVFITEPERNFHYSENGQMMVSFGFMVRDPHCHNLTLDQVVQNEYDRCLDKSDLPIDEAGFIARLKNESLAPGDSKRTTDQWDKL